MPGISPIPENELQPSVKIALKCGGTLTMAVNESFCRDKKMYENIVLEGDACDSKNHRRELGSGLGAYLP